MRRHRMLPLPRTARRVARHAGRLRCARLGLIAAGLAPAAAAGQVTPLRTPDPGADLVLVREDWIGLTPLSLEDVLARLAGVTISRRGGLGSPDFLNIAGALPGRVRVRVDGVDAEQPEMAWPEIFAIPLESVERIEVHRTTDPVRLEIWTRKPETGAPITEIDLGRGDLVTRTRRVGFWTPPRSWWMGAQYEELLRGQDDFRSQPTSSAPEDLGTYNGRSRAVEAGFHRPSGENLRLRYSDFTDNAHGSYEANSDFTHTGLLQHSLRYGRPWGALQSVLDLSYQSWDRSRRVGGLREDVSESRARLGVDLELPRGDSTRVALRVRAAEVRGARSGGTSPMRADRSTVDAELHGTRTARIQASGWLGIHGNTELPPDWSARAHLLWPRGVWAVHAQGGRGFSEAGWGEAREPGDPGTRPGTYAAAGLRRTSRTLGMAFEGYAKHLERQTTSTEFFFPLLGPGPSAIAGALADVSLHGSGTHLEGALEAHVAWTPWTEGERGGAPDVEAELLGRIGRSDFFSGDLAVAVQTSWRLETEREFTAATTLASVAVGDVQFQFKLLHALHVFYSIDNVTDARVETHPGVLLPGRRSLFGVRVMLEN